MPKSSRTRNRFPEGADVYYRPAEDAPPQYGIVGRTGPAPIGTVPIYLPYGATLLPGNYGYLHPAAEAYPGYLPNGDRAELHFVPARSTIYVPAENVRPFPVPVIVGTANRLVDYDRYRALARRTGRRLSQPQGGYFALRLLRPFGAK
jgi:hypothetical protein